MAVPVLMLFLLVQQLRWLLYRCSESVAAAVIMADGQIAHARDESFLSISQAQEAIGIPEASGVDGVGGVNGVIPYSVCVGFLEESAE